MGEAKRRGTREERVAAAEPKPPKMGAQERRQVMTEALTTGLAKGIADALAPIFGKSESRDTGR